MTVDEKGLIAKIEDYKLDALPGSEYRTACDDIIELITAYEAAKTAEGAVDGWQDISTAPKDGTPVLLVTRWKDQVFQTVGYWRDPVNENAGWMDGTVQDWGMEEYAELDPTHWRPLPAPPPPQVPHE